MMQAGPRDSAQVAADDGWRPLDCHAHTTHSDGSLSPEVLVETVRARGVRAGIADHCSHDVARAIDSLASLTTYFDAVEPLGVAIGGEFCWHDRFWREVPDTLACRFTHRIGSLHAVPLAAGGRIHAFQTTMPVGMSAADYMALHVAELEKFAAEMPVDILAHPALVPLQLRKIPGEELWSEEHEERAVVALARAGIAFELSNRYPAHDRLVRRARNAGVRFSLGSDGHTSKQVGDLRAPLALARSLGVRDEDLYDPFAHGSRVPGSQGR